MNLKLVTLLRRTHRAGQSLICPDDIARALQISMKRSRRLVAWALERDFLRVCVPDAHGFHGAPPRQLYWIAKGIWPRPVSEAHQQ